MTIDCLVGILLKKRLLDVGISGLFGSEEIHQIVYDKFVFLQSSELRKVGLKLVDLKQLACANG